MMFKKNYQMTTYQFGAAIFLFVVGAFVFAFGSQRGGSLLLLLGLANLVSGLIKWFKNKSVKFDRD